MTSNAILSKDIYDGLGEFPDHHKIIINNNVRTKSHPPRPVPFTLQPKIKEKLDELEGLQVIQPVIEPKEWFSSMLTLVKGNMIHICLDPQYLNEVVMHKYDQTPNIEEAAMCLNSAILFTAVNAKDSSCQKKLEVQLKHHLSTCSLVAADGSTCHLP